MLETESWGKKLGGGSIDIDFNLLSGSWEVRVAHFFAVEAGCGERVWFFGFLRSFFIKTFHRGGLRGVASDGDGAF